MKTDMAKRKAGKRQAVPENAVPELEAFPGVKTAMPLNLQPWEITDAGKFTSFMVILKVKLLDASSVNFSWLKF